MGFEILGTIASIFVLISFLFNDEQKIRLVNIIGALMFVVYGLLKGAFSVWFLNIILIAIHLIKFSESKEKK